MDQKNQTIEEEIKEWLDQPYTEIDRHMCLKIGMLRRFDEHGISPDAVSRAFFSLGMQQDIADGRVKEASWNPVTTANSLGKLAGVTLLVTAALPVLSYAGGRQVGSSLGGLSHEGSREVDRLNDSGMVETRRRVRHILSLTQDLEGDLKSKGIDPSGMLPNQKKNEKPTAQSNNWD